MQHAGVGRAGAIGAFCMYRAVSVPGKGRSLCLGCLTSMVGIQCCSLCAGTKLPLIL